jgi:hypothetical protein
MDQKGKKNKGENAFEIIIKINKTKNERKKDHIQEI